MIGIVLWPLLQMDVATENISCIVVAQSGLSGMKYSATVRELGNTPVVVTFTENSRVVSSILVHSCKAGNNSFVYSYPTKFSIVPSARDILGLNNSLTIWENPKDDSKLVDSCSLHLTFVLTKQFLTLPLDETVSSFTATGRENEVGFYKETNSYQQKLKFSKSVSFNKNTIYQSLSLVTVATIFVYFRNPLFVLVTRLIWLPFLCCNYIFMRTMKFFSQSQ
jgi:hypothetical protein